MVGYLFRVRVQEVLKSDRRVRLGPTVEVFVPFRLEGGVYLSSKQRFLLAVAPFSPKKENFDKTSALKFGKSTSHQGKPFDLSRHYYVIVGDANGAVPITDKNKKLVQEIRASLHTG